VPGLETTSSASVLVVDDEEPVRALLSLYLGKEGFDVVGAENGVDALSLLRRGGIDLALVDVMLPDMDGFALVRQIRQESTIPIIFITARFEEPFRIAGLEAGGDDYVVKPFSAPEVVARARAQLRRAREFAEKERPLRAGGVELDLLARRCTVRGATVALTRREFDLLAALLEHRGRVLTRPQLLELAWGSTFVSEKTVDVHVAALRRKLGDTVRITALRGVGYRLDT